MSSIQSALVVVGSSAFWPLVYVAFMYARFSNPVFEPSPWIFVPMGLVAGLLAAFWMSKAPAGTPRRWILIGYLIAAPFAFIGALFSGMLLPPLVGTLLCGGLPLILGAGIAYYFAGRRSKN